jgi:RNA polymerase sigma-70 factor (ECF subfamily)
MQPIEDAAEIADDRPTAPEWIEADQERAQIVKCLGKLEVRTGSAIRSAFYDGFTYAELADRMAVPLGTMKSWVRRGLMQLKACLGDG